MKAPQGNVGSQLFILSVMPASTRPSDNIMSFEIIYFREKRTVHFKYLTKSYFNLVS